MYTFIYVSTRTLTSHSRGLALWLYRYFIANLFAPSNKLIWGGSMDVDGSAPVWSVHQFSRRLKNALSLSLSLSNIDKVWDSKIVYYCTLLGTERKFSNNSNNSQGYWPEEDSSTRVMREQIVENILTNIDEFFSRNRVSILTFIVVKPWIRWNAG